MKHYKPGQLITIGEFVYRVTKRVNGCACCDLYRDVFLCPAIKDKIFGQSMNCGLDGIILKRI